MIEPWMLSATLPTVVVAIMWVRLESIGKSVDEIKGDVKRINGKVHEHEAVLKSKPRTRR